MKQSDDNHLDRVIYKFNDKLNFTTRMAMEGVFITGGIGSGKSSGPASHLAKAYLRQGWGGLVLCSKKDEAETWKRFAKETGRSKSLIMFDVEGDWCFPFLFYETKRSGKGGGFTENIVRLFTTIFETMNRGSSGGGGDPYWIRSAQELMRAAIDISIMAKGEVSIPLLSKIIMSGPKSYDERDSELWREKSLCWKLIYEAGIKPMDKWTAYDYETTVDYWMENFPDLPPKTRASIISMWSSMASLFMRRPFRQLFAETPDNWQHILYPEYSLDGAVIVLNIPVKDFSASGRACQVIYKYMWQQCVERRDFKKEGKPVFLFCDEAQSFINDYDMNFQATARASGACPIYITQNLSNFLAEMNGLNAKHRVESLYGNFVTKIFCNNSEPDINNRASEIIGKSWRDVNKGNHQISATGQVSVGQSSDRSYEYDVIPQEFSQLKKGSPSNDFWVEAIVFQSGGNWGNGKTYFKGYFNQKQS